jgi:hypothetical protein
MLTLTDLRNEFGGQSGIWRVYTMPDRDELGRQHHLDYYEGNFDEVLRVAIQDHGRNFLSTSGECGEIIKVEPKRVIAPRPRGGEPYMDCERRPMNKDEF